MRETARVFEVWFGRLAPDDVGVRRVSERARNRLVQPGFDGEETLGSPASGQESMIAFVDIAREQTGAVRIGARDQDRVHAEHRSEEHTSELQSRLHLVCRLL